MQPPPEATDQSGGVVIPGTVGSVGGDMVGRDKVTIYGTVHGYKRPTPGEQAPINYVDRPELTGPLLAHLLSEGPSLKGRATISALHGMGGIGKTTVARWLVWQPEVEDRFPDGRLWITLGNDPVDALTVINDCVSQLNPAVKAKATKEAARADLAALLQDRSILFVIDDIWPGRSAEVAKALLVPSPRARFLLTTRFAQLADDPAIRAENFPLDEMSAAQALELITRTLGRAMAQAEQPLANQLCDVVGGHPLAVELAAARIKEGHTWEALLHDLAAEIARLDALEEADDDLISPHIAEEVTKKDRSVRASLLLSVRYMNQFGQRLFAYLGVTAEDAPTSPRMAATLWSTTEDKARKYLGALSGAGLVKAVGDDTYGIHDLVHDLARNLLTAPETPAREGNIPGLGLTLRDAVLQFLERYRAKTFNGLWHTLPATATSTITWSDTSGRLAARASSESCSGKRLRTDIPAGMRFANVWVKQRASSPMSAKFGITVMMF